MSTQETKNLKDRVKAIEKIEEQIKSLISACKDTERRSALTMIFSLLERARKAGHAEIINAENSTPAGQIKQALWRLINCIN